MRLSRLQAQLPNARVTRDKPRQVHVRAAGLAYTFDTRRFASERELAEHARSLLPVASFVPSVPSVP